MKFGKPQKFFLAGFFILVAAFVIVPLVSASAQMMQKKKMPEKPKMMNKINPMQAKLIAEGKRLFYSKSIGTNGFSCATCHVYSAGTYIGRNGKGMVLRPVRPMKNTVQEMMTINAMGNNPNFALEKRMNVCVRNALKGHASKSQLKALAAYIDSLT
ncbi:MAG: hypothetical protein M1458_04375 [Deltaproteobacteria bacterium]|nr:hypothetical protein [Deltaproteobacteria bacterium]